MKRETYLVSFYVLYFGWLTVVTFFSPATILLNYFTGAIIIFYFLFLKEKWDLIIFSASSLLSFLTPSMTLNDWKTFSQLPIMEIPFWLPFAWGTTVIALRKLYTVIE